MMVGLIGGGAVVMMERLVVDGGSKAFLG